MLMRPIIKEALAAAEAGSLESLSLDGEEDLIDVVVSWWLETNRRPVDPFRQSQQRRLCHQRTLVN